MPCLSRSSAPWARFARPLDRRYARAYTAVMPRPNLSLPHERRKAKLKSRELALKVQIAERKEALSNVKAELTAMKPKPKTSEI